MLDLPINTAAPSPCPHLGLASDPSTSCLFVVDSHRCFRRSLPEAMDGAWQRRYCISGGYALCPRYSPADGSEQVYQPPAEARSEGWLASFQDRWDQFGQGRAIGEIWRRPRGGLLAAIPIVLVAGLLFWILVAGRTGDADQARPQATPSIGATPVAPITGPAATTLPMATATTTSTAVPSPSAQSASTATSPQAAATAVSTPRLPAPSAGPTQRPPTSTATPGQAARTPTATHAPAGSPTPRPAVTTTPGVSVTVTATPTRGTTVVGNQRIYVVVPGDNLWQISSSFSVSVDELVRANDLPKESTLQVGQKLIIPEPRR